MQQTLQPSDRLITAEVLTMAGGFLDAYTYYCRGGVFANAQSVNMVLFSMQFVQGEFARGVQYLIPVFAFALGILLCAWLRNACNRLLRIHWRIPVVGLEIALLLGVAILPHGATWDMFANTVVSVVAAMQMQTFRKVEGNPMVTTMCTGNLRSATELLYLSIYHSDRRLAVRSWVYVRMILCFVSGAGIGAVLCLRWGDGGLLPCCALLALVMGMLWKPVEQA